MKYLSALSAAALVALLTGSPVFAHHSLEAEYDFDQQITVNGTITKVDWSNPHVHMFVDVMDANRVVKWEVEMGSPNAQILSGWKLDTMRPGDHVVVSLYRARNGSNLGFARKMTKAVR
jgi:hypothetical protein